MKKIINNPMTFVEETLEGIIYAHPDQLRFSNHEKRGIVRSDAPIPGKVAIATGGGSGHLPVFLGYVGKGLADGSSVVFLPHLAQMP
ncbi:dihydroxyacetone kinase subunit DhaK [Ammoniphilus sp. 3BR4]|uniref:dihydroxyacetone kinase subunit DhaK n=1 Tax=Ammoniphilus sp. 3BR4 TaxID=3158265 RepID=UPI0034672F12